MFNAELSILNCFFYSFAQGLLLPNQIPTTVAAVDLGSNSFHMIICNLKDGKLQVVDRLKEMVRLAAGMDEQKNLDKDTQVRALACLERFGQRIRDLPSHSVSIVGTNTLRSARNAEDFITRAEQALGHSIHIISGIEEARLIYQGVAHSLASSGKFRFVMDIGGGSTEYIIGQHDTAHTKESLGMGCVTVSNRFFKNGEISKKAFKKACLYAEVHLEPFQDKFHSSHWDEAIGASGSLKAISHVLESMGWSNNGITLAGLEQLVSHLLKLHHIDQISFPNFNEERRPVFMGAVAITYATFVTLIINQMTVSDGALREGLVYELLDRIYDHDIRSQTSRLLAERYRSDRKHSAQIQETLHHMIGQLQDHPAFSDTILATQFLDWAADLHEIGLEIAHSQYHKHSAYIIENGDLAGFSKQDQMLLARLVRNHRKKLHVSLFSELASPWRERAPVMALVFRIAFLIHRNRHTTRPDFKISIQQDAVTMWFSESWLKQAPLTDADLQHEIAYLKDAGFKMTLIRCAEM